MPFTLFFFPGPNVKREFLLFEMENIRSIGRVLSFPTRSENFQV